MSLKVYFKIASFATIMCLLYIHMQMKIYELSYKGKDKEKIIHELNDSNGALNHQILTLESANHLGNQLLDRGNNWQFMGQEHVLKVVEPTGTMQHFNPQPRPKVVNPVWNLLS